MKKIVLVTWKGGGNYGTCLQCFALYRYLQNVGYKVSLLSYKPSHYTFKSRIEGLLSDVGLLNLLREFKRIICRPSKSLQVQKREGFQNRIFNTIALYSQCQERKLIANTDCFVTGSDQIWNTYFCYNPFYFLAFVGEKKRIAYASSIGTNSIKDEYKKDVKKHLLKFHYIGVRENKAVKVLSELTGRNDIQQVLDPTFLLSPDEWREMSKDAMFEDILPKDYILCYLIGQNSWYKKQLYDVHMKSGIKDVIVIPAVENPTFSVEGAYIYKNASPVEFVRLLQDARLVCTDSFHATALSINHSIPFVEFMRFKDSEAESQNSRIYDVLTHYHMMDRLYQPDSVAWLESVNYEEVQNILSEDRKISTDFLINSIEN